MAYTTLTLDQAVVDLGRRLNTTPGYTNFWSDAELTLYINEALQAFNAHASFNRETFSFDLVPDQYWYDISDLTAIPTTLRGQSITDVDLFTLLEYHLLEPPTGVNWSGSKQFTIDDLLMGVQHRRDQLLYEAGHQITRTLYNAADYATELNDSTIDVRRVAWLPDPSQSTYFNSPMWRDDQWELSSFRRGQGGAGQPGTFRLSTQPPLTMRTDYQPIIAGNYEILSVDSGAVLSTITPTILAVPNDFAWVVKFGALADLLNRDGVARDPLRAQYAEMRYKQGLALLRSSPAVLDVQIEYVTMDMDAVQNADNYKVDWQGRASGVPTNVYTAGLNLIAFSTAPDDTYPADITVVRNAPIPTAGSDFLQVGREDYDAILDYAQHLASFKQGGAEFASTLPLLNNFVKHCKLYNSKLLQMGEFTDIIFDQSREQEMFFPRTQPIPVEEEVQ